DPVPALGERARLAFSKPRGKTIPDPGLDLRAALVRVYRVEGEKLLRCSCVSHAFRCGRGSLRKREPPCFSLEPAGLRRADGSRDVSSRAVVGPGFVAGKLRPLSEGARV